MAEISKLNATTIRIVDNGNNDYEIGKIGFNRQGNKFEFVSKETSKAVHSYTEDKITVPAHHSSIDLENIFRNMGFFTLLASSVTTPLNGNEEIDIYQDGSQKKGKVDEVLPSGGVAKIEPNIVDGQMTVNVSQSSFLDLGMITEDITLTIQAQEGIKLGNELLIKAGDDGQPRTIFINNVSIIGEGLDLGGGTYGIIVLYYTGDGFWQKSKKIVMQ